MQVHAYLSFDGRCEEALKYYEKTLGAKLGLVMRFSESPDKPPPGMLPPGAENKIMHSELHIGDTLVMATDGNCAGKPSFSGISLAISVGQEADARRLFDALAKDGQVQMPLGKTFFSPAFGMLVDRFGINWMVVTDQKT